MDPSLIARVLDRAVAIQQIPAPPFAETERAAFVHSQFQVEGLLDVSIDSLGNVFGRLQGSGSTRPLVISAHLDSVFPHDTDLRVAREAERIYGPGIGDNALGVAGLFGLLWCLREVGLESNAARTQARTHLPGDIWLVANVGEEGLGDLRGMRRVVDRFADQPLAYLVLEGMALGQIYHRGLGVKRFRIRARTSGGHSWVDHGKPSAIHELAALINRLTALELPEKPRTSLNVGVISGGTGVNTIAAEAHLELDLRSEGSQALQRLARQVEDIVASANRPDVQVTREIIGQRPAGKISASHPLVQVAKGCLEAHGVAPNLTIGSTDANLPLSRGFPAVCLGLSTGFGAHTVNEYVNTPPLAQGLAALAEVVAGIFEKLA
jgi:acetylornithine deacetylase/succinyl-diaminopimelate desuccinylase-like protein